MVIKKKIEDLPPTKGEAFKSSAVSPADPDFFYAEEQPESAAARERVAEVGFEQAADEERARQGLPPVDRGEETKEPDRKEVKPGDTWTTDKGVFVVNANGSITQYALGYAPPIEEDKSALEKVGEALFGNPLEAGLPEGEKLVGTPVAIGVPGLGGGTVLKMVESSKHMQILTSLANKAAAIYKNSKLVRGIVMSIATAAVIGSVGGKVFTKFLGMEEAAQTVNIAGRDALLRGDIKGYELAAAERNEILQDNTFWESLREWIPWANVLEGLEKYRQAAITGGAVYDRMYEDAKIKAALGENDVEYWKRVREQQLAMEKASVDYYNSEREKMVEWELAAEAAASRTQAEEFAESRERERAAEEAARERASAAYAKARETERGKDLAALEQRLAMEEESRRATSAAFAKAREKERQAEWEHGERERAAERKARLEEAAFWRKEREKIRQEEAAERIAIAKFWLAYRIEIRKIKLEQSISNLNFDFFQIQGW